jgi:catechol 2,3-dioxygenase-like lactoylglutathione lyase family enzyme
MTVGVAQVVLNTGDLDAASRPYLARGWKETFRADRLPSHPAKVPFQAVERNALDMSHLAIAARTSVEVTRYAGHPPAGATVYVLDGAVVRVRACEPGASHAFWRALGFTHRGPNVLEVPAMLPAWRLHVALEPSSGERPHTSIDADGCVLVTLLTTAIERELERLAATGLLLRCTSAWEEQIGGRMVTVAFIEGPSGELVELLQVAKGVR